VAGFQEAQGPCSAREVQLHGVRSQKTTEIMLIMLNMEHWNASPQRAWAKIFCNVQRTRVAPIRSYIQYTHMQRTLDSVHFTFYIIVSYKLVKIIALFIKKIEQILYGYYSWTCTT
jgi:hypothetical protein